MEPSNRDRDTEGDKENPKEKLRSGARGGGGERALGLPRPGSCPPSPRPPHPAGRWWQHVERRVQASLSSSVHPWGLGGQKGQEEA